MGLVTTDTGSATASMRARLSVACLLAGLASTGCGAALEDDVDESTSSRDDAASKEELFRRVVIARAYQRGGWTLPNRDATYVCNVLADLKPTFVSGLLRFGSKEGEPRDDVTPDQKTFFHAVRSCMRGVHGLETKFDVVLNADEYASAGAFVDHMQHIDAELQPDAWYFDFFARGWDHHRPAVRAAIEWAHDDERKQRVGGTIWGQVVPDGADYVALDDYECTDPATCDGVTPPGWTRMTEQAKGLRQKHPGLHLLFHIENNPTGKVNNHGEDWIRWPSSDQRIELLNKHANNQDAVGYRYMYPVFFPLSRKREGQLEQFEGIAGPLAWDAYLDPPVYARMKKLMAEKNPVGDSHGGGSGGDPGGGGNPNGGKCDTWAEHKECRHKCEAAYANKAKRQACKSGCDQKCQ